MPTPEKKFVVVFKNISSMQDGDKKLSPTEKHFDIPWNVVIMHYKEHLGLFLHCQRDKNGEEWSVEVLLEMNLIPANGRKFAASVIFKNTGLNSWGTNEFIKWDDMMKNNVIDDTMTVEAHMTIKKMTGIEKKNLRNFDESMKEFADVVLEVEKKAFYVSKLFLAEHSPYFKTRLLKSKKSEFPKLTFKNVKAPHLQNFLEVLYGESSIAESTIDGIVHLAKKFDAKIAIQECEKFLINDSKKILNEKLELADRYQLENLNAHCHSKITTVVSNIITAHDISEMDPAVIGALLQQSLALV